VTVDSLGLIWALLVTPAGARDRDGGRWLPAPARGPLPRPREAIADSGFSKRFAEWVRRRCGWAVTITKEAADGFRIQPRRWVAERTLAWLVRYRRLRVDFEYLPETGEAMIRVAMIHLMPRRLHPTR
jgi:putative transposase